MWSKWTPDPVNEWELICRECDEEFYVWQSCGCSEVDSGDFLEDGEAA